MDGKDIITVVRLINSHMWLWNTDKNSNVVLPIPVDYDEKFVHACDYLASRNFLNICFTNNEIVDSVNRERVRILKK